MSAGQIWGLDLYKRTTERSSEEPRFTAVNLQASMVLCCTYKLHPLGVYSTVSKVSMAPQVPKRAMKRGPAPHVVPLRGSLGIRAPASG